MTVGFGGIIASELEGAGGRGQIGGMDTSDTRLGWGILGAGRIAGVFAKGLAASKSGRLVAVGSRSEEKARAFGEEHGPGRAYGSYEALLADAEVAAVYVATPHPEHVAWVVRAAEAGKHVLCEKPMGVNHAEGMVMAEAAQEHGVVLMEAFMYRCHPQTAKLVELIRAGVIGEVGMIRASFGFKSDYAAGSRLWSNELGGGGILDVGCYPMSMARLIAGAVEGRGFADPVEVGGSARLHPESGVDVWAGATLKFASGVVAQLETAVGVGLDNTVRVYGTAGVITVPSPWVVNREGGVSKILLRKSGEAEEEILVEAGPLYALEADAFAGAVRAGAKEVAAMTVDDTLGNLAALDRWREAVGLVYGMERPAQTKLTLAKRPLQRRAEAMMPRLEVPGVRLPMARLVMGCDNQRTYPHAAAMFDAYFEQGGNAFDTAFLYGQGRMERLLGAWMESRGVRDEVVVVVKGGHTPFCTPEGIRRQFEESLQRLRTDRADIYCLHRDNPALPAGELVEVMNEWVKEGKVGVFGGSNWTLARVEEANRYAESRGLQGFGVVSNNFSLARMVSPVWGGCVAASDAESRAWLTVQRMPVLAWSSQARGFFTERGDPARREDAEMVRCWQSEDNFERRRRAYQLAEKKGVKAVVIAAAYVLQQRFPTLALIGPRTLAELRSSLGSLGVELTPEEVAWLNLE